MVMHEIMLKINCFHSADGSYEVNGI